jgi:regulator of RNase E activity RraA
MERTERRVLTEEAKQKLLQASTATITTQLLRIGFRHTFMAGVVPLSPDQRMVGYAFTLRYVPAREDVAVEARYDNERNVQRLAVEAIGPEDVLVIDARSDVSAASFGHIIATRIRERGAAGLVTDGALRDTAGIAQLELPTYYRAAHATTSAVAHHPVDMNVPIGCAGVLVMPGDVLVGDSDGVVVIPSAHAEAVAHASFEQEELEAFLTEKVAGGASIRGVYPPDDDVLREYEARSQARST